MKFVNLTPHKTDVLDDKGEVINSVEPSGTIGLAAGDPPKVMNVPPPSTETVYIVLPAIAEASSRDDLLSIVLDEARRSNRGNVRSHVAYWTNH